LSRLIWIVGYWLFKGFNFKSKAGKSSEKYNRR
jgi:hypothetical protein